MPDPRQEAAAQALQFARQSVTDAIANAEMRRTSLEGRIQTAERSRDGIDQAAQALQGAAPADMNDKVKAGIQAAATGLQDASALVSTTALAALTEATLDEWKECRNTIDRCDKLLVDLRKTGFGFITAVVGAAAYVFAKPDHASSFLKSDLLCALVVLILVLYLIDLAHQSWLLLAVKRAEELEGPLNFRLTQLISSEFAASRGIALGSFLYFLLLLTSCVIFLASIPLSLEDRYSAPRANIYGAFAVGFYVIVAAPLISEILGKGLRQASKRDWSGLFMVTSLFIVFGFIWNLFGPLRGFLPQYHWFGN